MRQAPRLYKAYLIIGLMVSVVFAVVVHDLMLKYGLVDFVHAEQEAKKSRKTRKTPALRQNIYTVIAEAQEYSDAKQYAQSLEVLSNLERRSKLNSYESAMVSFLQGFCYYGEDKYQQAIVQFKKIVGAEGVPLGFENRAISTLAQLYFLTEDYSNAIKYLTLLVEQSEAINSKTLFTLAQAYYLTQQYDMAIKYLDKVIVIKKGKGKKIDENTLLLQQACYYEKKNFLRVAEILEKLVEHYPKKQYWIQLSAVYSQLGKEKEQLAAMDLAYRQGYLSKASELEMLAQLYMYHEVPYKAAKLLEKEIEAQKIASDAKNWKLLADAWRMAKELGKAIFALDKAAKLSDDGKIYARLAELFSEKEQWDKVITYSTKAINKDGLKEPGRIHLLKGIAYFNEQKFAQARQALSKAKEFKNTRRHAKDWLKYAEKEEDRLIYANSIIAN